MAIIILCFWYPSPKHHHDLHCHRHDTLISIFASWSSRQLLLLQLSLTHSDKVKQLHGVCISYNKVTTIRLLSVADNFYKTWSSHTTTYITSCLDYGSPGLGGPRASGLLDMGRTDGPSRYKTEDHPLCPVGTPVCVDGEYRCPDILFLSVKPTLYNPKPLPCLYKPEGRSEAGPQHC